MVIYIMPSLLDVIGTIVDTAGLYYVQKRLILDQCISESDAQRISYLLHLHHNNFLSQTQTFPKKASLYVPYPWVVDSDRRF